jgi:hypothetical protein
MSPKKQGAKVSRGLKKKLRNADGGFASGNLQWAL